MTEIYVTHQDGREVRYELKDGEKYQVRGDETEIEVVKPKRQKKKLCR